MNCAKVNMLMFDYIDNQLDYQQRSQFEEHLKNCSSCRDELYKYELIIGLCKDIEEEELPSDFKAKLHERLINESNNKIDFSRKSLFSSKYIKTFTALAAGLLLVILFRGVFLNQYIFNTKVKMDDSSGKLSSAAYSASVSQEEPNVAEDSAMEADNSGNEFFIMAEGEVMQHSAATTDSARSFVERGMSATTKSGEGAADESITTVDIVLKLDNADSRFEDLRLFIMDNGAEPVEKEEDIKKEENSDKSDALQQYSICTGPTQKYNVINAKVPDMLYDSLMEKLTKRYGTENLIIENINSQDIAPLKKALTDTLNNIDKEYKNAQDIDVMKQSIRDEIEKLVFNAGYMYINVKVVEKEE
ncbi:MAG TPA: zf-HC2 domain-containing protein [Clostridiaceae bacterium]|nr:zf-HC2 domain-containing protein [Clostridiaceae bacterium]